MGDAIYDLVIVGGGINGCGIARDAAGRGLKVLLVEQDDLASATSSWSSKLIHGGLRYLEHYEFRLVREALQEREVLLRLAPHLIHPLEFILPHDKHMRPAWMVQVGLLMYDHLGGRVSLPHSRMVPFPDPIYSAGLKSSIRRGFFYSDAKVDDARLTVLNAISAREHGADILTRTKLVTGSRSNECWRLTVTDMVTGNKREVRAKGLVNAAGPWVKQVLDESLHSPQAASVRLVKGSHIVVPRVHDQGHAYILQNPDKRVIFIIPFEGRFSLIGTTDVAVGSIDEGHQISQAEVTYLLQSANRYLANSINENDIVWSYAGVRPLYDDGARNPSEITRDYVLKLDHESGRLPLLSVFGGKITTYRRLAEHALADLSRFYDHMHHPWTANEPLPGGDIESTGEEVHEVTKSYRELPIDYLTQLVCRYGSRVRSVLGKTCRFSDLGASFGAGANMLCEREIDYLIREEWARHPADILWRRTKTGLHMTVAERAEAESFIGDRLKEIAR